MRRYIPTACAGLVLVLALSPLLTHTRRAAADEPAAAENPAKPPRRTGHDAFATMLAYNRKTLVGVYDQVGNHDPKWDEPARALLEKTAIKLTCELQDDFYWPAPAPTAEERRDLGRKAVDAGCDDPLVLYSYYIAKERDRDADVALLRTMVEALKAGDYPPQRLYPAAARLARATKDEAERKAAWATAEECRVKMVCQPLDDGGRRTLARVLNDDLNQPANRKAAQALADALDERKDADVWVRDVFAGRLEIALAWDARGSGTIDTVTEAGGKAFLRHLTNARARFKRAWKAAPQLPEAPAEMIIVSMGAGDELGEKEMDWFERATDAQVDFQQAYEWVYTALMPRWGGSFQEIMEVADACAQVGRYDTRVPEFFEFGIQTINRDVNDWARVYADRHNYDTVVKVMEGYAAALATKNPRKAAWYKSYHAAAAWRTGKLEEAKKVLDEQGEAADPRPFQRMGVSDGRAAISQVYAYSGPHAAELRQADAARQNGDDAAAAKVYTRVLADLGEKDPARRYVAARARAADAVVKLAAGEWVDVQPVDGLAGWRQVTGTWQVDADGALVGRPHVGGAADRQKVLAWTGAVFGEDEAFEIAGHFEFVGQPDAKVGAAGALIVADDFGARGFVILDRDKAKAVFYFGTNPPMAETEVGTGNDFLVRYDHKTFTLEANGKPVGKPFTMTGEKFAGGLYAGVGGVGTAPVKFTKLKLRRVVKPEANEK